LTNAASRTRHQGNPWYFAHASNLNSIARQWPPVSPQNATTDGDEHG
jgi:hypothetical protein